MRPDRLQRLPAVGRLDHDTTGLLLMSDDGPFIHAQSSPKRHVPKVYQATTAEPVTEALVAQFLAGIQLNDEPAPLRAVSCVQRGEHLLEIVLEQGEYHQVKRMLAAAGNHSSLNVANALGAALGGAVIAAGLGYTAPAVVGAGLAVCGLGVLGASVALQRRVPLG